MTRARSPPPRTTRESRELLLLAGAPAALLLRAHFVCDFLCWGRAACARAAAAGRRGKFYDEPTTHTTSSWLGARQAAPAARQLKIVSKRHERRGEGTECAHYLLRHFLARSWQKGARPANRKWRSRDGYWQRSEVEARQRRQVGGFAHTGQAIGIVAERALI